MSDTRRGVTLILLGLLALTYGFTAVVGLVGSIYPVALDDSPLTGAGALIGAGLPALVAAMLFVAVYRQMSPKLVAVLFGALFVVAAFEAIAFGPKWGATFAINGLIPLLVVIGDLRRGLASDH